MGSVKDLETIRKPTKAMMGVGRFHFSDRYSVFDWGEMPDHVDGKGEALCLMGAHCFEKLREKGIENHYRGLVAKNGKVVSFEELEEASNTMEINLVNVIRPETFVRNGKLEYDYSAFTSDLKNCLVPLEIIYRNGLPEGSSIFKRLEQRLITIDELGLNHFPKPGERLSKPIFDVSTKLEEKDRYVTWEQAQSIAGLTNDEVEKVKRLLLEIDEIVTQLATRAGLENEDGKIELALDPSRRLMVVDVVGTLDECRFTYNGLHVSKEIARQFYRKTNWYKHVEEAKEKAEKEGVQNWQKLCRVNPPKLDPKLKTIIGEMYRAASNEMTGNRMFDAPSLAEAIGKYRRYIGES
jgi:phosphoribosylaminoimidazole-succinocarboxamide synthase